jgi:hypothetical protein
MDPVALSLEEPLHKKAPQQQAPRQPDGWLEVQLALLDFVTLSPDIRPTEAHFEVWLLDLPYPKKAICTVAGFRKRRKDPAFRCFHHELLVFTLGNHMRKQLSAGALALWYHHLDLWTQLLMRTPAIRQKLV